MAAVLAGAAFVVIPEIEHGLAEVIDDIGAIEIDVFRERPAVIAVKDDVLVFAGRPPAFDDDADGIGRADGRMRHVRGNKKRFSFADEMIDDPIAFPNADFDVALELVKIFLGIDEVKIVPRVRAFDDHDEKVAAVIKVTIADRRLKQVAVCFDPGVDVNGRQHFGRRAAADGWRW